ncbi:MAG: C25 family cysteine peptidase [Bacteroidales bacterium]|nr:C25 family cysteine peptidase [Bacteroidales bacterium]
MKNFTTLLISLFIVFQSFATDWTGIRSEQPKPGQKQLISSNIDQSIIRFSLDGFLKSEVNTPMGQAMVIGLEGATQLLQKGAPDLPKMTASVIIPDLAGMQIEVLDAAYRDFENILVAPSKGNLTRDIDPSTIHYEFGKEYTTDAFFPGNIAGLREPYIVRDYRGQTVIVYPFQYNPVSRTLRVYTDITVKISRINDLGQNSLVRIVPFEDVDGQFDQIYQRHFLNPVDNDSRYTPVPEFGNMLIISFGAFMDAMQPFVDWKKQEGYPVEIVDVGTIGNSTAIKSFIANYYNTKGLTFVLLVGDAAQVPTSSTSAGDSDNNYAYIVGNDHYPDLFVGRFSAENIAQVETQVQRTLDYERNPVISTDWFSISTGIGSDQGPGDDNEFDYQHIRNIQNNKLIPFTYTYANELFDGSQGGNDEGGNPTPSTVATAVNAGTGIINYTGHGSDISWGTTGFSVSDVNNLVNDNLLPFIWSVACVNGNFVNGTCFAEAWLRATHNGQPTGAVAFLGATINQSWDPPMVGQDEMNDIMVETYPGNINRTFGALSMHGCMQMNDEFGSGGNEMTDTWVCFGDPSVMVRTTMPENLTATHDPVLFIGATQLTVICDAEGARITLSMDGAKLSTAVIQGGSAILEFAQLNDIGTATLTITTFNHIPYIADIDVIPANGPYVVMDSYDIADVEGNNNGLPDYNESIDLSVGLENVGIVDANNVMVTLTCSDPYIIITDYSELYPVIPAGQTISVENGFAFSIASDVPDQHPVTFNLSASNGANTWESVFIIKVNAPILHINYITINDTEVGNGDGELDPGERADLTIDYSNTGHATAYDVGVYLEGQSGFVELTDPLQNFSSIGFFGVFNKTYAVIVDELAPEGIKVDFVNELTMGDLLQDKVFPLKISANVEDFETGDFSKFNWQSGGNLPWQIVNLYPYEGYYSVRSGAITHNQTSEISLTYNVMTADSIVFYRKVSSESSDLLKFYINNQLIEDWSGTTGGWKREAFAVGAGNKTFKWVYEKNSLGSTGSDCAWLDYIVLPSPMVLTIWAGPDDDVCTGESYQLDESYGTDYNQVQWTSSGTGNFDDNTNMHPLYNPSSDDINSGEVMLTLTLWDDTENMVADEMLLGFTDVPAVPDIPQGPDYVDLALIQISEYSVNLLEESENYNWYLEPAGAGMVIADQNNATVSWDSTFMGTAYISVAGTNECGEGGLSEAFEVTVDNSLVSINTPNAVNPGLVIYPNPSSGVINLDVSGPHADNMKIGIYNLLGSSVLIRDGIHMGDRQVLTLDLSSLPNGIYILTLIGDNYSQTRKLIIQ